METGFVIERNGRYLVHLSMDRIFWSKSLIDAKLFDSVRDAMDDPSYIGATMAIRKIEIKLANDGDTSSK